MSSTPETTSPTADREIVLTRIFDAPRELVWKAWTSAQHVAQWWGPVGFTSTISEMDVRVGGAWNLVMHGPDGRDYINKSVFREVVPPELLVYDHISGPVFRMTATFEEHEGKTRLTARMVFETAELRDKTAEQFGAVEGLSQTFARLAEHLNEVDMTTNVPESEREVIVTRLVHAPRELVWKVWTQPEHIAQWWGPKGFTNTVYEMEVKPGGVWRYLMQGEDGVDYPNRVDYLEVVEPERLVFLLSDDVEEGGESFESTVTFEEQDGGTYITMRVLFDTLEGYHQALQYGVVEGGKSSLDCLEEYLRSVS